MLSNQLKSLKKYISKACNGIFNQIAAAHKIQNLNKQNTVATLILVYMNKMHAFCWNLPDNIKDVS